MLSEPNELEDKSIMGTCNFTPQTVGHRGRQSPRLDEDHENRDKLHGRFFDVRERFRKGCETSARAGV